VTALPFPTSEGNGRQTGAYGSTIIETLECPKILKQLMHGRPLLYLNQKRDEGMIQIVNLNWCEMDPIIVGHLELEHALMHKAESPNQLGE